MVYARRVPCASPWRLTQTIQLVGLGETTTIGEDMDLVISQNAFKETSHPLARTIGGGDPRAFDILHLASIRAVLLRREDGCAGGNAKTQDKKVWQAQ